MLSGRGNWVPTIKVATVRRKIRSNNRCSPSNHLVIRRTNCEMEQNTLNVIKNTLKNVMKGNQITCCSNRYLPNRLAHWYTATIKTTNQQRSIILRHCDRSMRHKSDGLETLKQRIPEEHAQRKISIEPKRRRRERRTHLDGPRKSRITPRIAECSSGTMWW